MRIISTNSKEIKNSSGDLKYEFNDTTGSFIKLRKKGYDSL